jgi:hypothetical protein
MGLTITQKADTLGTFRFVCVRLMETLAAWVPTSPELEVKTLFGRHIWQLAQHADAIGHRTVELRAKLHYDREPRQEYLDALRLIQETSESGDRVAVFYDVVLPDLAARFRDYLERTDDLLDAPTVEILRRILGDVDRMLVDRRDVGRQRTDLTADPELMNRLQRTLAACGELVDHRDEVAS